MAIAVQVDVSQSNSKEQNKTGSQYYSSPIKKSHKKEKSDTVFNVVILVFAVFFVIGGAELLLGSSGPLRSLLGWLGSLLGGGVLLRQGGKALQIVGDAQEVNVPNYLFKAPKKDSGNAKVAEKTKAMTKLSYEKVLSKSGDKKREFNLFPEVKDVVTAQTTNENQNQGLSQSSIDLLKTQGKEEFYANKKDIELTAESTRRDVLTLSQNTTFPNITLIFGPKKVLTYPLMLNSLLERDLFCSDVQTCWLMAANPYNTVRGSKISLDAASGTLTPLDSSFVVPVPSGQPHYGSIFPDVANDGVYYNWHPYNGIGCSVAQLVTKDSVFQGGVQRIMSDSFCSADGLFPYSGVVLDDYLVGVYPNSNNIVMDVTDRRNFTNIRQFSFPMSTSDLYGFHLQKDVGNKFTFICRHAGVNVKIAGFSINSGVVVKDTPDYTVVSANAGRLCNVNLPSQNVVFVSWNENTGNIPSGVFMDMTTGQSISESIFLADEPAPVTGTIQKLFTEDSRNNVVMSAITSWEYTYFRVIYNRTLVLNYTLDYKILAMSQVPNTMQFVLMSSDQSSNVVLRTMNVTIPTNPSSTPDPEDPNTPDGETPSSFDPTWLIVVGGVVAGLVICAAGAALFVPVSIFAVRSFKKRREMALDGIFLDSITPKQMDSLRRGDSKTKDLLAKALRKKLIEDFKIHEGMLVDIDEVVIEKSIGSGGFKNVYMAQVPGVSGKVVFKSFRCNLEDVIEGNSPELERELRITQYDHKNIERVLRVVLDFALGRVGVITPFMKDGSLSQAIREDTLSWKEKRKVLKRIADALTYLHGKGLLHCDIKPDNVLLETSYVARDRSSQPKAKIKVVLTDFGSMKRDKSEKTTAGRGLTEKYLAPEVGARGEETSDKSDCYAYGMVALEVVLGHEVASEYKGIERQLHFGLQEGSIKWHVPKGSCPDECAVMIKSCLNPDPKERPTMLEISRFSFFCDKRSKEDFDVFVPEKDSEKLPVLVCNF